MCHLLAVVLFGILTWIIYESSFLSWMMYICMCLAFYIRVESKALSLRNYLASSVALAMLVPLVSFLFRWTDLYLWFANWSLLLFLVNQIQLPLNVLSLKYLLFNKVDETSPKHGGQLVAQVLKSHNVEYVFTLVGGHISPILVAAEEQGIRVIDTRHEVNAVFAADAVARLTGRVGVAAVTAGPGLTNTITAVKNAEMALSPLLLLGGAAAGLLKGRGALQDIDQMSLFKSFCKFTATVTRIRDIVPTLKKAIQEAMSGIPGPVFVEFPIDVLYPYAMVKREMGAKGEAKTLTQKVTKLYMDWYLQDLFGNAFEPKDTTPLQIDTPKATHNEIQRCAKMLSVAKRPLILVGSQATLPPIGAEVTGKVLEQLGVPCFLGGMARGLLGRHSPLQIRQERKEALKEADLVILAGTVCDFRLGYGRVLSRQSKIVSVNRSKKQMLQNSDLFWKPSLAVHADVGSFLSALASSLEKQGGYTCDPAWLASLRSRDLSKENKNKSMAEEKVTNHLNPIKVLMQLEESLGEDTIMVADGGDFVGSAAYILRPRGPLCWLDPGAFGTLGVGAGFALGAKLVRPDMDVVIVYGDGSAGYSIMEYDTFRRFKLPILSIIGNDACWTQISREQVPLFKSNVACQLEYTDYHDVATALGAKGIQINEKDSENLEKVFQQARDEMNKGHGVVINALIGKSAFRDGSLSV